MTTPDQIAAEHARLQDLLLISPTARPGAVVYMPAYDPVLQITELGNAKDPRTLDALVVTWGVAGASNRFTWSNGGKSIGSGGFRTWDKKDTRDRIAEIRSFTPWNAVGGSQLDRMTTRADGDLDRVVALLGCFLRRGPQHPDISVIIADARDEHLAMARARHLLENPHRIAS